MRWDTIYFDLDDTLLSYEQTFKNACMYTFKTFQNQWGIEEIDVAYWFQQFKKYCDKYWSFYEKKVWTKEQYRFQRFYDTMKEFQIEANNEMVCEFQAFFSKIVGKFAIPIEGIEKLLMELKKADIQLGIITNGKKTIQMEKIRTVHFEQFFSDEAIIISEEVKVDKPNPEIFSIALSRLLNYKFPPLYIGDSWPLDIVGATNARWDTIYFNTRNEPPKTEISIIDICQTADELYEVIFS